MNSLLDFSRIEARRIADIEIDRAIVAAAMAAKSSAEMPRNTLMSGVPRV